MRLHTGLCTVLLITSLGIWADGLAEDSPAGYLSADADSLSSWTQARSLEFTKYPSYAYLKPAVPQFVRETPLSEPYRRGLMTRWTAAAAARTFEAEHLGLEDFSEIDIPIKFPSRIGRVIGQGANLSVSGSEQISFGGQTRYRVNEPLTEYGRRSKFPTLDMKQHLKIDLKGTVGEKIHVMVHHDSEIETPLENRIKLRYQGDDDEIVQSIEMGNTNLSLPGSQFVSYSGKQQGLFGAKMDAKLGPLDLTAVASKQEGRTAGHKYTPSVRDSVELFDYQFVRNKYFFIVHPYNLNQAKQFTDVVVYLDNGDGRDNDDARHGYAFMDPSAETIPDPAMWDSLDYAYEGDFDVLSPNDDYAVDLRTGEISLLRPLTSAHTLAVTYVYGDASQADTVGGIVQDSLKLKMIRPNDEKMTQQWDIWGEALQYERKNVYSLNRSYITEEKVEVVIYKLSSVDTDIQRKYEYSKILGLDIVDENGAIGTPDNNWKTDGYVDGGKINGDLGLLLFPDLRPFDPDIAFVGPRPETLEVADRNPDIYDKHPVDLRPESSYSKFRMIVRFATAQTTFKLPHMNILENSEVVTLDGVQLARNVDYEIYYDVGQIRFKTDEAMSPDARISVDYQYVPFLSLAQQSLVGLQGIYRFSERSHIGGAWIYQSTESPEERPRLGQEPSRTMMADLNTSFDLEPALMTSLIDALPMVEADSPSRLTLSGELGMSFPNPNTKGDVYIDDMEGVRDLRSFSVLRESWLPASPPTGLRWEDNRRIWWYVNDDEVKENDLFTKAETRLGEGNIPVLEIRLRELNYGSWAVSDPSAEWAGLMRLVSKTGSDYSELGFIEVWLRQKSGSGGLMHFDLGALSENFYHPWALDSLHTEDKNRDGELSTSENVGLDGVGDGHPGDDPNDNWGYTTGDYSHINGTEGDPRITPDTEDLDGDGNLDTDDIHFRLSLDLDDTTYVVNEGKNGWRQYRIPLARADTLGGSPTWRSIKYIRFFFTEIDSPSVFQIAYLQVAGASWLEEGIRTKLDMELVDIPERETFEISAKNTRDDPDYNPPYDPGKDPEGYSKREQSLVFTVKNLDALHAGSVYKLLPGKANDYMLYEKIAFYVHGDSAVASEHLYLFVRVGIDSVNFYEYGTRVKPGWRSVEIPLAEITSLKSQPGDSIEIYRKQAVWRDAQREDGWIAVCGEPSMTRVSRIGAGLVNLDPDSLPTSSHAIEVWFDDLRLTGVRKEAGFAKRLSVRASFSDVLTVNADFRQTDTEFQTLSAKRSGTDDTDWSISASTGIHRYLPDIGLSLPFSVRYHKSHSLPTLKSRSDIALTPEERWVEERINIDDSYRLGLSRRRKSRNPLIRLTLDAISASVSYSRKRGRSPELADTSSGYTGSVGYKFSPWWDNTIRVFRDYRIAYLPETVTMNVSGSTRTTKTINRRQGVVTQDRYARNINGVFDIAFKPITGRLLQTDYSLKMTRDLDLNKNVPILTSIGRGIELTRAQRASVRITPTFGRWMRHTLSYDVNYDENSDPKIRSSGDPAGVRRVSVSSRSRVDVELALSSILGQPDKRPDTTRVSLTKLIVSKMPDVAMGYVLDRNSKYNKLLGRPGLMYQLGLEPVADRYLILTESSGAAQPTDDRTRKDGYHVSTDFSPTSTVSLGSRYQYSKTIRTYAGTETFQQTSTWPDLTANVSSITNLGFMSGILKSSSLAVGYTGTSNSSGQGSTKKTKESRQSEWLPLIGWDATWSNGVRTTFNIRRSTSEDENLLGARSLRRTTSTSVNLSIRHSFSAPQGMYIPLAGRTLRFKSNLTLTIDLEYESRLSTTPTSNDRVDKDTRKYGIIPQASYSFSKNITGSASARFIQDTDRKLGRTWRTIGITASVLIRF